MTTKKVVFVGAAVADLLALGIAASSAAHTSSDIYPLSWSVILAVTVLAFYVLRSKKVMAEHGPRETQQGTDPRQPGPEA